jgi:membrane fusion protein, multidrug efflux system
MRLRPVIWLLALLAVASLPSNLVWRADTALDGILPTGEGTTDRAGASDPPVPIVAGIVRIQNVPIYLFGLGTVQAFNTVTVRSRVDGQLERIAFREGQDVRAGDVLAQIDARAFQATLRQAEANLRGDEAKLRSAKAELERTLNLATRDFASRQSVDIQRALVAQLEAALDADRAQIDNAKIQLEYTVIRSPIDGRTGLRLVDEGNIVRASDGAGIVVIVQLRPIAVVFSLPEEDLPKINRQMGRGSPAVTAFARDGQTVLATGTLSTIDNTIDRRTGTFKLKAHFENEEHGLWPGQFVNVRLHLATRRDGVVVSEAAVQRGPQGAYVFVITPDSSVAMQPVKVAQTQNGMAVIDEGLRAGDRVVVDGQHRLQPRSRIVEVSPAIPLAAGSEAPKL